jgi:hypothetical protein
MIETIKAWQCIGCGRVEADAQCLGICQDRPVHLVSAADYERLEAFVRRVAQSTPRDGQWERSYRAIRSEARRTLGLKEEKAPLEAGL